VVPLCGRLNGPEEAARDAGEGPQHAGTRSARAVATTTTPHRGSCDSSRGKQCVMSSSGSWQEQRALLLDFKASTEQRLDRIEAALEALRVVVAVKSATSELRWGASRWLVVLLLTTVAGMLGGWAQRQMP